MANYPGTSGNDNYYGTSSADLMNGLGGKDWLYGNGGNDTINGGDGDDTINGGSGDDSITGGSGSDYIDGGDGNDAITPGFGWDTVNGGDGNDIIFVDAATDYSALVATDSILGGTGQDTLSVFVSSGPSMKLVVGNLYDIEVLHNASTTMTLDITGTGLINLSKFEEYRTAGGALGWIYGSSGSDTIKGFDLYNISDTIVGNAGNDQIEGLAGNDNLYGLDGVDLLSGGLGDDLLFGGNHADRFVFRYELNEGHDAVWDYVDGTDKINISNPYASPISFSDLTFTNTGADCIIKWGSGTEVLVRNISSTSLDASDFLFT